MLPAFLTRHGYMLSLVVAAVLGLAFPTPGSRGGILHLDVVTQLGIMLVFFLHGANLAPKNLRQGISNWRLHIFVQAATYVVFPLLGAAIFFGGGGLLPEDLLLGIFYLCVLPSTIASSVAMTVVAHGNIAGAIFNATLSGLLGMLLTPVLLSVVISTTGHALPMLPAIVSIVKTLLLPFVVGQLLRVLIVDWLIRHRSIVTFLDRGVIVLIVHASFCESSKAHVWSSYPLASMVLLFVVTAALLVLVLMMTTRVARWLHFSTEDEIAAVFCGSKKSLANGMPMANVLLAGHAGLGVLVLPMMIYHQLQLLVCSVLAQRYAARSQSAESASVLQNNT